ncbi:zinc-dependent peptidase [Shewanella psychropiezotolerans]|uniref:Zinc-dependent peptidase n=1 Tax=Shewanella psychropiezotolerans TaxID=2593655 RepID=A0ABX5X073_9GAMM|nr:MULTISPECIES: M90 family metallopeptidase [Shewanella]MPY24993.1 zinc-dependent peptidase [Shewanella sp. YLB-07]QDO83383.1 zinc-dependent peptidase [Shewanella psychropiezotolerans]
MIAIFLVSLIASAAIGWIVSRNWRIARRRMRITQVPFPKPWREVLKRRMPYFRSLPADLQLQLKKHIQVFLSEKEFVGCDGIIIDDEMRVTIAAQACLLLLNRSTDYYPNLKQILVYPSVFFVNNQEHRSGGVVSDRQRILSGESWQNGKVILSWQTAQADAANPVDGSNVVIHEFAHQLDQEDGNANGAPILDRMSDYSAWSKILSQEFDVLQRNAEQDVPSLFSYYGATNPAEFFAVITEVFFERPDDFYQDHRELYQELSLFFKLDPVNWH